MVQIIGTYELVSQENYEQYLKALGVSEEHIQKVSQSKSPVVISALDDSKITASYGGKEVTFTFNQETEHTLPTGTVVKTVASRSGDDTIVFKTKTADGRSDDRVFKITDSGLTSTSTANGVAGIRKYKRA